MRYPHRGDSLQLWQILGATALLLAITAFVFSARRFRYLTVGWLWFLISMVPMTGIVHFGDQALADRYAYQSFCGLFLMICWGAAEWTEHRHVPAAVLPTVGVVILSILGTLTYRQVQLWGDDLALWSHTLQVTSNNVFAEDRVGEDLQDAGRRAEAVEHFRRAVVIDPSDIYGNLQLAFYEHQRGNLRGAIEYYKAAVQSPEGGNLEWKRQALANMGHAYGDLGDIDHARQCFEAATKLPVTHESRWKYTGAHP
jgi:tetratricopeptide (TPR) repeat protein